ncbi:MAG TPA: hypothetical protein VHU83_17925 [Bryobacteraceae bacterium]|jgi:hypothetical protein|nr:hypothetical protein [Bryobacteraceae bacterium]
MVIALAGRRMDAPDAKASRFPPQNEALVAARLRRFFEGQQAAALVCSAACGADLLALEAAGALNLRCRIVLPFPPSRFRERSVADRPGDWGQRYDRLLAEVIDVIVLDYPEHDPSTYARTNGAILDNAAALSAELHQPAGAAVVWDGQSRGPDDVTAQFLIEARARFGRVAEILTLP